MVFLPSVEFPDLSTWIVATKDQNGEVWLMPNKKAESIFMLSSLATEVLRLDVAKPNRMVQKISLFISKKYYIYTNDVPCCTRLANMYSQTNSPFLSSQLFREQKIWNEQNLRNHAEKYEYGIRTRHWEFQFILRRAELQH